MSYQAVFQRYELKYLLTQPQRAALLSLMPTYMKLDDYGRTTIRNVYFDTDSFLLARRSIEKPIYKEKLRLRCYGRAEDDKPIFVELKKKCRDVVYKRRMALPEAQALRFLAGDALPDPQTQIGNEIGYFRDHYHPLRPAAFLSYEREAFFALDGGDFRLTLDEKILARREQFDLASDVWGESLLLPGQTLMELKCSGALPLWITHFLTRQGIAKTSFSKYGAAYSRLMLDAAAGGMLYA